jgi:hypothetical protein
MNPRLLLLSLVLAAPVGARAAPPNVVCILADDLGWSDVSAHPGGTVQTPSIDRLIKQGVELRNFMGWCVCSPTRAMLLTGRHSFRVGSGPEVGGELTAEETTLLEGGTRLVAAMHWPRGGLVGGQAWEGLCGACDLLPTLADMCGLSPPAKNPLDGRNIWPALQARGPSPVESYYWAWRNQDAIRTADWRLHRFFDHFELHDIRQDVGQTNNLADTRPDIVRELTRKMDAWANSLGAALSHQAAPMALDAPAAPEGEVLEITVTVTDKATPSDFIVVPITAVDTFQYATDYIEFDVSVSVDTPAKAAWYYSPFKGEPGASPTILFKKGEGIDQCGRDQSTAPGVVARCVRAPGQHLASADLIEVRSKRPHGVR